MTDMTLSQLAQLLSVDTAKQNIVDIDDMGIEILTPNGFKPVSSYVVKKRAKGWKLGDLLATKTHRVFDQVSKTYKHIFEMPNAIETNETIDVVDLEVPDGECYIANGWVNHNTTPGG